MSKISEKNSAKQKKRYLLRPWKEWGIDLYLRFKKDVFFSTRIKIVLSHIFLITFIVLVTVEYLNYAKTKIQISLVELVSKAIATGNTSTIAFDQAIHKVELAQWALFAVVSLFSLLVGLIVTRLALEPVRDSLITQKRFIESISHELRTSLAVLKTQNEVAKLDPEDISLLGETLDQNIKEIDHISEILNNLLLFNRVDTIDNIVFESVDLTVVIETVLSRLKRLAEHRGVTLEFLPGSIPPVYGNATGLEQMLFNLVKNGIIYTPRGGTVKIGCITITEYDITLRISDTGIGIEKSELPHIFKLFYRTDTVQETTSGTGLGLALVYEIIKLHNGKIRTDSTPGVGTQFDITLPRQSINTLVEKPIHDGEVIYDFSKQKKGGE